jgi:hypothetical protein
MVSTQGTPFYSLYYGPVYHNVYMNILETSLLAGLQSPSASFGLDPPLVPLVVVLYTRRRRCQG